METDNQYAQDSAKLAALIERYTGIAKERTFHFIMENAAAELLPCANMICETDTQKEKLAALFEFKNLYETVKAAEHPRSHQLLSAKDTMNYFINFYADKNDNEQFAVAYLDTRNKVIAAKIMYTGTPNEAMVYPRAIVKDALFYNATGVVMAHNHPGGSTEPSPSDIVMTDIITKILHSVSIKTYDHIIVGGDSAVSLASQGRILVSDDLGAQKAAAPTRESDGQYRAEVRRPGIKQQLAAGRKQLAAERTAVPVRTAAKTKLNTMEV